MRPKVSPAQIFRHTLHVLLAAVLLLLVRALRQHPSPSVSPSPPSLANASGQEVADATDALLRLYIEAKTGLLFLLLVHLPWLLSLGGTNNPAEMVRGADGSLGDSGDRLGMLAFEKGVALAAAGLWTYNWMHLRHPLANSFVSSYTAAVACLSFALALLLFCQQCHPPYVVGTDPLDVYFASSPLVFAQQGDKEPDAMPHNNGFSQEGAKAEAILISDCLLTGVLIGVGLIVGAAAAGITAVLNYQPSAFFLPLLMCSTPLLLYPSALPTPRPAFALSVVILFWYRSAVTYALDERGAPTCGVWDPQASDKIRRLAPLLCHLAKSVYYFSWCYLGGLTWLLVDLYACLSDNLDDDATNSALGGHDVRIVEEVAHLVWATVITFFAPVRRLPSTCLVWVDVPIHLA